mmetsp:Transcript_2184/g.3433  ORF Transcript_2184/g.3433 Transcript_2184/m.3433 type:complete len:245 (-) Transcript_2184:213-947(-)|eukprot:CAMPEP_0174973304 /NCGR_PEP_ID=MMETSP0004_2-20121128/11160_1 /TAXON_ID=420556 /ORGANISM="Ochromonas sp., Strain CCMP1393" /LENGTH=244 /DNA_ID=CAMNT_0016223723 /DNA_START=142 /DNA_END=876 /DNA_ORIENTATION=+
MYSTKLVNKNVVSDNAYITVGDPYADPKQNPFRQPKKGEKAPTPFQSKLIPINAENGHFSKIVYVPEGYKETNKYITTQPLDARKRGFGTKDAHRRDEFSNNIRTEQYRESIRKESELLSKGKGVLEAKLTTLLATKAMNDSTALSASGTMRNSTTGGFDYSLKVAQYDIGRNRITPFDPKSIKDTYYKFEDERPKRLGTFGRPVSCDVGATAWEVNYQPPSHGGKSLVKNFFDKSHLGVGHEG